MSWEFDRGLLDALKVAHNRGADLYNTGDPGGAFRLYQGALFVARGFLAHRPDILRDIEDGLAEVELAGGNPNLKAFRLHEVVDSARANIKNAVLAEKAAADAMGAKVVGAITRGGAPAAGVMVMLTAPGDPVATAAVTTGPAGDFVCTLPAGSYTVTVAGPGVPVHFGAVTSTPLALNAVAGLESQFAAEVG